MPVKVLDRGEHEIFETDHGHEILVLDGREGTKWFALVRGQKGDILVRSDADHKKEHTIGRGRFYLVDFIQDPKFRDVPHLFLQKNGRYEEWILPNGLPTASDPQKRVVLTDESLAKDELEDYLKHPAPPGPGEERSRRR
ncbi:MAG: hypothetical protein QOH59_1623 [Gemmatimonadales bacterium]|jgi:hypothetical protein|nr:hypothetical protein [Gemmatimonadales bacterium]